MDENKPINECPECGSKDVDAGDIDQVSENVLIIKVDCTDCDFRGIEEWVFQKATKND
jgi:C4-type Zn-finger protein